MGCPGSFYGSTRLLIHKRLSSAFTSDYLLTLSEKTALEMMNQQDHDVLVRITHFLEVYPDTKKRLVKNHREGKNPVQDNCQEYHRDTQTNK